MSALQVMHIMYIRDIPTIVFKLLIDNIELFDNEFILPNIVVLIAFKLSIFNSVNVDKMLK